MTKTFDSATVTAGGASQTFTITVTNTGVSQADDLNVSDLVDPRLEVSAVTSAEFTCAAPSQTIDCDLANLDAGATATIVVTYSVDTATEADATVDNTADATSDDGGLDSSTDDVAIVENVVLTVDKEFADVAVDAGTSGHTFTIDVTNTGVSEADNINVLDTIDPRLVVSSVTGDFSCTGLQSIDCDLASLGPAPRRPSP